MCDFFGKLINMRDNNLSNTTIIAHVCIVTSLHLIESDTNLTLHIHVDSYGYMCCIMGDIFIILKKLLSKENRHGEIFTTF